MKDVNEIVEKLKEYNKAYREGSPLVSDNEYDLLVEKLKELDPEHPWLEIIEPETFESRQEVRHPVPMLSTEKAYTEEELIRFVTRVEKAAGEIGITDVLFEVTAKLDGLAGRDDGEVFATRGNGDVGYEISSAFAKGVIPLGGRGRGLGEIVMVESYFNEKMADKFEHPRNMVVGIITSDKLNEHSETALKDGKVHFVPYAELPKWAGTGNELIEQIENIKTDILDHTDYPTDGLVASVVNPDIRKSMGATAHHYRWQSAIKTRGETGETTVENIVWQVGRTGNVTPVMEVRPLKISGATIRRVTAHNAGMLKKRELGPGAIIEIIRSGEVIPKLEKVVKASDTITIPETCPVCDAALAWNADFLKCNNLECDAKKGQGIVHWFKILGNADWFGGKTVQKLVDNGFNTLEKIYAMTETDFSDMGFGPVQSKNLYAATAQSRSKSIEDWRFLAALGISNLGMASCRQLLSHFTIEELMEAGRGELMAIHGFGDVTSQSIIDGISQIRETITHLLELGFNLQKTPKNSEIEAAPETEISGKGIVFTGKMLRGTREEMQEMARSLGAVVQTSVSGKTDFLVCGENVGAKKIEKAEKSGAQIISEDDFIKLTEAG